MVIAGCQLGQQSSDARRATQNIAPYLIYLPVRDIGVVALDVHFNYGRRAQMPFRVKLHRALGDSSKEKIWKLNRKE